MSVDATPESLSNTASDSSAQGSSGHSLFSYRGPVAGLKGLLTKKVAEGVASVVSAIDRVTDMAQRKSEGGTEPIAMELIFPCADQPRQVFEPRALEDLSQTMKELGQAQAITVRKTPQGYEIISGERRYRAAKLAGLTHLDCVVKDCTPSEGRLLALVENIQRQDLLPIEEAHFLKRVLEENEALSLERLAKMLGSHKSTLSEKIQLTEIPEDIQPILYAKGRSFTHRHWRVVSRVADPDLLRNTILQALEHQLSVAELERSLTALGVSRAPRRKPRGIQDAQTSFEKFNIIKREGRTYRIKAMTLDPEKITGDAREKLITELESLLADLRERAQDITV